MFMHLRIIAVLWHYAAHHCTTASGNKAQETGTCYPIRTIMRLETMFMNMLWPYTTHHLNPYLQYLATKLRSAVWSLESTRKERKLSHITSHAFPSPSSVSSLLRVTGVQSYFICNRFHFEAHLLKLCMQMNCGQSFVQCVNVLLLVSFVVLPCVKCSDCKVAIHLCMV